MDAATLADLVRAYLAASREAGALRGPYRLRLKGAARASARRAAERREHDARRVLDDALASIPSRTA